MISYWRCNDEEKALYRFAADRGWLIAMTDLRAWVRREIAAEWGHTERQSALEGVERHLNEQIEKFTAKHRAPEGEE